MTLKLHEVFNEAGLPEITYVAPAEAQQLKGSLATPGKHVTLVGPSGSGKSTVANRVLESLNLDANKVHGFSGRSYSQATSILEILGAEFDVAPSLDEIEPWLQAFDIDHDRRCAPSQPGSPNRAGNPSEIVARKGHSILYDRNCQDK